MFEYQKLMPGRKTGFIYTGKDGKTAWRALFRAYLLAHVGDSFQDNKPLILEKINDVSRKFGYFWGGKLGALIVANRLDLTHPWCGLEAFTSKVLPSHEDLAVPAFYMTEGELNDAYVVLIKVLQHVQLLMDQNVRIEALENPRNWDGWIDQLIAECSITKPGSTALNHLAGITRYQSDAETAAVHATPGEARDWVLREEFGMTREIFLEIRARKIGCSVGAPWV